MTADDDVLDFGGVGELGSDATFLSVKLLL